jgi:hypothetical protein
VAVDRPDDPIWSAKHQPQSEYESILSALHHIRGGLHSNAIEYSLSKSQLLGVIAAQAWQISAMKRIYLRQKDAEAGRYSALNCRKTLAPSAEVMDKPSSSFQG